MIADLKAQQLNRSPPKRRAKSVRMSRQGPGAASGAEKHPAEGRTSVEPSRFTAEINKAKTAIRESQERPAEDSGSESFQNQVMLELQKLKKVRPVWRCVCSVVRVFIL